MTTFTEVDLTPAVEFVRTTNGGNYPWFVIGVFPTETSCEPEHRQMWWNSFLYTVGLSHDLELWIPYDSIEGHGGGYDLMAGFLNVIAAGFAAGLVGYGDTLVLPIGVPDADDGTAVFWLGQHAESARRRQVFQSPANWCLPILWSSCLGWSDD